MKVLCSETQKAEWQGVCVCARVCLSRVYVVLQQHVL